VVAIGLSPKRVSNFAAVPEHHELDVADRWRPDADVGLPILQFDTARQPALNIETCHR
jgi:hypothetical protein